MWERRGGTDVKGEAGDDEKECRGRTGYGGKIAAPILISTLGVIGVAEYSFLQAGAYDCTHASPMIRTTPAACIIQTCTRDSSRPTDRASARGKRAIQS